MPIKTYTEDQQLELKIRQENIELAESDLSDIEGEISGLQEIRPWDSESINHWKVLERKQKERLRLAREDHGTTLFRIGN